MCRNQMSTMGGIAGNGRRNVVGILNIGGEQFALPIHDALQVVASLSATIGKVNYSGEIDPTDKVRMHLDVKEYRDIKWPAEEEKENPYLDPDYKRKLEVVKDAVDYSKEFVTPVEEPAVLGGGVFPLPDPPIDSPLEAAPAASPKEDDDVPF